MVEARGLRRVYGSGDAQVTALDGVSLAVQQGQFVAVMGASGSGKSTLLHCLAGLDAPTQGQVLIAGRDLTAMRDRELTTLRRDLLGFVFQAFNLLPTLTAQENILLPLRLARRRPDAGWFDTVVGVLGIQDRLRHRPAELSGGQQQRVAVARALIGRPAVVFADEPTGALDTASSAALLEVLAQVASVHGEYWSVLHLDLPDQLRSSAGSHVMAYGVPDLGGPTSLTDGRLPQGAGELAIDTILAQSRGLRVGDTLSLVADEGDEDSASGSKGTVRSSSTVVGIVSAGPDSGGLLDQESGKIYATTEQLEAIGASTDYFYLYVTASPGADTTALVEEVAQVVHASQPEAAVAPAEEVAAQRAVESTAGGGTATVLLSLLALVCVLVAGIVIASTFTTLMARQTRQVGLVRCVGATRRQVLGSVLRTGALTGLVGSVAGAVLGVAGAALLARTGSIENPDSIALTVRPTAVLLTVVTATLVTLVSVLRPARRAARVSPLVAATGQDGDRELVSRRRRRVAVAGAVLLLVGLGATVMGMVAQSIGTAAAGGMALVIGIVLALPLLVTAGASLVERLCSAHRFPVLHLAARNLSRDPGRSAASAATVLVGVGVGTVLFVGLFSFQSSLQNILDDMSPRTSPSSG